MADNVLIGSVGNIFTNPGITILPVPRDRIYIGTHSDMTTLQHNHPRQSRTENKDAEVIIGGYCLECLVTTRQVQFLFIRETLMDSLDEQKLWYIIKEYI